MRHKARYFDSRTGRELSEDEALTNGIMRNGVTMRVHMTARDSFNRPGWRILDTVHGQAEKAQAYGEHERWLNDAWRGDPAATRFGDRGMHGSCEGIRNDWPGSLRRWAWDGNEQDDREFDRASQRAAGRPRLDP